VVTTLCIRTILPFSTLAWHVQRSSWLRICDVELANGPVRSLVKTSDVRAVESLCHVADIAQKMPCADRTIRKCEVFSAPLRIACHHYIVAEKVPWNVSTRDIIPIIIGSLLSTENESNSPRVKPASTDSSRWQHSGRCTACRPAS
jgi:hypothetical protein